MKATNETRFSCRILSLYHYFFPYVNFIKKILNDLGFKIEEKVPDI